MGLIITEHYLKQNSIVNENADMKVLTPTVILVQDKYIHPMLGSDLFNEIQGEIDASTPGTKDAVSTANQALLDDYVLPCMLWYILHECTPVFKYRYMNKGIMVKNSENSSAADLQEIQFLMDKWKDNAEMYAERCKRFLYQEANTYPKFYLNPNIDDIKANKTNYTAGFNLDDPDDDCCFRYRT